MPYFKAAAWNLWESLYLLEYASDAEKMKCIEKYLKQAASAAILDSEVRKELE